MARITGLAVFGLLSAHCLGCADLHPVSLNVCGNGVVEPARGEDCDGRGPAGSTCGAPDTAHACRYLCQAQKDCPSSYSCGLDGICRRSSSTWTGPAAATLHSPEPPLDFAVADADGDGKGDVFEESTNVVTVHYDVTSSIATEHAVTRDPFLPAIGPVEKLADDALADAVVPADLGYFVSLGTQTRTERATAYGAISLPDDVKNVVAFSADVLPQEPGTENIVLADIITGQTTASVVVDISTLGSFSFIGTLPDSPAKLAGRPRSGKLNENASAVPCEELVFGYKGKSSIDLMVPCKPSASGSELVGDAMTTPVALPHGATVAGTITISDLDQDGHLDLLVPAARGDKFEIDVAYGRGDGTFASTHGTDPTTPADGSAGISVSGLTAPALSIADLDGDEQPDWVDAAGVYLSRGKDPSVSVGYNGAANAPWTSALITDLNADALPDVVVGSDQASYVVAFLNTRRGAFTEYAVATPGNVTLLCAGDFDGDRIGDVAMATSDGASSSGSTSDTLSVMFGSPYGAPVAPRNIGEFHHITQLAMGQTPTGPMDIVDGADDLGALAQQDDGSVAFSVILGRGDRALRAPYDLTIFQVNQGSVLAFGPVRIVPADIDGDGLVDLVSLGQRLDDTSEFRFWANPMQSEASIRTHDSTISDPLKQGFDWTHVLVGALDLDGMPGDELAVLGPRSDGSGYQSVVASSSILTGDTGRTYTIGQPTMVDRTFTRSEQLLASASVHNGRMRIADVDGDGKKDVIALGQMGNSGSLVVFFNDETGDLGKAVPVNGADKLDVRDFAVADAPGDDKPRIVLLTTTGVFAVDARQRELSVGSTPALAMTADARTSPYLIAAGDVDGDGVPDLVLGGTLSFELHLGISGNPLDAH